MISLTPPQCNITSNSVAFGYKVVIGDDQLVHRNFWKDVCLEAGIEEKDIYTADTKKKVLEEGINQNGGTELLITDLNYTTGGQEGFSIIEFAKGLKLKNIWLNSSGVSGETETKAKQLGATQVLDKIKNKGFNASLAKVTKALEAGA